MGPTSALHLKKVLSIMSAKTIKASITIAIKQAL
jgi:hypothetical protein